MRKHLDSTYLRQITKRECTSHCRRQNNKIKGSKVGNTHDDDEVEIDLRELFYALKKHILVILAAILAGAVIAGAAQQSF